MLPEIGEYGEINVKCTKFSKKLSDIERIQHVEAMALAENSMIMDGIEVMQTQQSGTQSPDPKKATSNPARALKSKDFDISKVLDGGPSLSVPARSPRDPNTKSVMLS